MFRQGVRLRLKNGAGLRKKKKRANHGRATKETKKNLHSASGIPSWKGSGGGKIKAKKIKGRETL